MFLHTTKVMVDVALYLNPEGSSPTGWRNAFSAFLRRYKKHETREQLITCINIIDKAIQNNVRDIMIRRELLHKNKARVYIETCFMFEIDYKNFLEDVSSIQKSMVTK